ncbi:hypothetical protein GQ44DRAFT_675891 [Phaeosphaeriaceae sp. PMI808]|nr:hypothetical protein GQ44DRAFT_675891 [Phaeosphaeriaceae sp. PMI808]
MPVYHACCVSVRLGAMPLADTITPHIVLKKGETAKKQCEDAEQQLLGSELLHEERVDFPGDLFGFQLNWLGGAPFMQVQARKNQLEGFTDKLPLLPAMAVDHERQSRRSATSNKDNHSVRPVVDPLALVLHVKLSDETFTSGLNKQNKVHLKIDVFFNGKLSSSMFIRPYEVRSGTKSMHQVFSGYRADHLSERPWIILPSQKTLNGSFGNTRRTLSVDQRWQEICQTLQQEIHERGMDKDGNIPPSAEFLKALSIMQMPDQVRDMQSSSSKTLGIIDVVITAGNGNKSASGTRYLKAPKALIDERFPLRANDQGYKACFDDEMESNQAPRPKRQTLAPPVPWTNSWCWPDSESSLELNGVPKSLAPLSYIPPGPAYSNPHARPSLQSHYFRPHHEYQHLSALPPTGLFSVPTKPKTGFSLPKDRQGAGSQKKRQSLLVKRLIITGKNGTTIVNHQWSTAQPIIANRSSPTIKHLPQNMPRNSLANLSSSKTFAAGRHSTEITDLAQPKDAATLNTSFNDIFKRPMSSLDETIETSQSSISAVMAKPTLSSQDTALPQSTTNPMVQPRHPGSGNNFLGVQGPKAVTSWLEDPEEILRRSKSVVNCTLPINAEEAPKLRAMSTSSPLSSVPPSPEIEERLFLSPHQAVSTLSSIIDTKNGIAQVDGSSERKMIKIPLHKFAPCLTESTLSSTPNVTQNAPAAPGPSQSHNTRKRKLLDRHQPSQPQSVARVNVTTNPQLNQDCVISFAGSEGQSGENSMLRQVRSEKQGMFAEQYVVLATRFFIAGN